MANRLTTWWQNLTKRSFQGITPEEFIGQRTAARAGYSVTPDTALKNSAVWACLRIRADLMSTFPLDTFRKVGDGRVDVPKPQVLKDPGGDEWDYTDWMYATQFDQDRCGNSFGFVTIKDGNSFPYEIEPLGLGDVSVRVDGTTGAVTYRLGGTDTVYTAWTPKNRGGQIWHERQYPISGSPLGLSPIAYAASVISENMSTQTFAQSWFARKGVPAAQFKNTQQIVDRKSADEIKSRFGEAIQTGDLLVTGMDWEYSPLQAEQMGMEWLEDRKLSVVDIARFFGVPADLIDAAVAGQSITYANITERNLQFLIMNLGPAVARREKNLSKLMQAERFVKLNTNALLRMDPKSKNEAYAIALESGWMTVDEVRALEDRQPLTAAQLTQITDLKAAGKQQPAIADQQQPAITGGK